MPRDDRFDELGNAEDQVRLEIDGDNISNVYETYEVKVAIIDQPAAFSVTLGHGGLAREFLGRYKPGMLARLRVGPVVVQTARLDAVRVNGPTSTVNFRGRDKMASLTKNYVTEERAFKSKTYFELTQEVLRIVGLEQEADELFSDNDKARQRFTGHKVTPTAPPRNSKSIQFDPAENTFKTVYDTVKATLGQTWHQFLQNHYKLAGLFLWVSGEGQFILSEPNTNQPPGYRILRRRGQTRNAVNVIDHSFENDITHRHGYVRVYGHTAGGKHGVKKIVGRTADEEMIDEYGDESEVVFHDEHARTKLEAQFISWRRVFEERREGYRLSYTMSGHRVPSLIAPHARAVWGPDTIVDVQDDELGIFGPYWIEAVTFSRKPHTTTTVQLMKPDHLLLFAGAQ
jgi:prophage tail gpP-like protein